VSERMFDRVEILGRLRVVETGEMTKLERELTERVAELEAALRVQEEKLRDIATREWRDEGGRIAAAISRDALDRTGDGGGA